MAASDRGLHRAGPAGPWCPGWLRASSTTHTNGHGRVRAGGTLADWVLRLVETGKGLGETHAERALSRAVGEVDRSEVKVLRGQILHEILQFRATLRDELEDTADADFEGGEALVFGYFDELTAS